MIKQNNFSKDRLYLPRTEGSRGLLNVVQLWERRWLEQPSTRCDGMQRHPGGTGGAGHAWPGGAYG